MIDDAYSLAVLPTSLRKMTINKANAIEANLRYLILELFPYFNGEIKTVSIGSYGFLELTETATVGDAIQTVQASHIDKIKITISGSNLNALTYAGAGWAEESRADTEILLSYTSAESMTVDQIQAALNELEFSASDDLDAEIVMQPSNTVATDYMSIGPVYMFFRSGTTWLLVEGKHMTWNTINNIMTWDDFENLKKE